MGQDQAVNVTKKSTRIDLLLTKLSGENQRTEELARSINEKILTLYMEEKEPQKQGTLIKGDKIESGALVGLENQINRLQDTNDFLTQILGRLSEIV